MKMKRIDNPTSVYLSTALEDLDKILHGGIACGSLTEVKDGYAAKYVFLLIE